MPFFPSSFCIWSWITSEILEPARPRALRLPSSHFSSFYLCSLRHRNTCSSYDIQSRNCVFHCRSIDPQVDKLMLQSTSILTLYYSYLIENVLNLNENFISFKKKCINSHDIPEHQLNGNTDCVSSRFVPFLCKNQVVLFLPSSLCITLYVAWWLSGKLTSGPHQ